MIQTISMIIDVLCINNDIFDMSNRIIDKYRDEKRKSEYLFKLYFLKVVFVYIYILKVGQDILKFKRR